MFLHLFLTVLCHHSPLPLPSSILPSFPLPYSNLFIFPLHITFTLLLLSLKPHPIPLFYFLSSFRGIFYSVQEKMKLEQGQDVILLYGTGFQDPSLCLSLILRVRYCLRHTGLPVQFCKLQEDTPVLCILPYV